MTDPVHAFFEGFSEFLEAYIAKFYKFDTHDELENIFGKKRLANLLIKARHVYLNEIQDFMPQFFLEMISRHNRIKRNHFTSSKTFDLSLPEWEELFLSQNIDKPKVEILHTTMICTQPVYLRSA